MDVNLKNIIIPKDINIKVTLHECRKLLISGSTDTPSPYAIVKILDKSSKTQIFEDQQNPIFKHAFEFSLKMPLIDLKSTKILISVYSKTVFYKKDILIGEHSIDAYTVYNQSSHNILNVWGNLEKEGNIYGSVNFSVLAISEGDKIIAHIGDNQVSDSSQDKDGENKENEKAKLKSSIIGKPQIEVKEYLLLFTIFKGEIADIPDITDYNIKVRMIVSQNELIDTISINNTKNPTWRILHSIPMKSPFYIDNIVLEIIQDDDSKIIGRILINFKTLQKDGIIEPTWCCFYGPLRNNSSFFTKLKYQYEIGKEVEPFYYAGRILIDAKLLADSSGSKMLNQQANEIALPFEKNFTCWVDFYELSSNKISSNDEIYAEIQVGSIIKTSKKPAIYNDKTKKFSWSDKRFESFTISLPVDQSLCPDVFIRIYKMGSLFNSNSKNYLAYKRFSFSEIIKKKNNISVVWENLRMIFTQISGDSDENFLGLLLCSLNIFSQDEESSKRPIVISSNMFKKYKLIGFICMGSNLSSIGTRLPDSLVEISFNGKTKRTGIEKNTINPVWNTTIKITTTLNENLELSDNIKLSLIDKGMVSDTIMGKSEISLTSIKKYNNKDYIDTDLYKLAQWYNLYEGTEKLETKILGIFFIVKLVSQTKEEIFLDNTKYKLIPDEKIYRLYMFCIGVRQMEDNPNLNDGYTMISYNKNELEVKEDKSEFFKGTSSINQVANLNNLDQIGELYSRIYLAIQSQFIKNLEILVKTKDDIIEYTTVVDLSEILEDSKSKVLSGAHSSQKDEFVKKLVKKPQLPNGYINNEEIIPLYNEQKSQMGVQKSYIEMLKNSLEKFPLNVDDINNEIGEETYIDNYYKEVDKRGKAKDDDDTDDKINRPEIDYNYEEDLAVNELEFYTRPLKKSGEKGESGFIRFIAKLVEEEDDENLGNKKLLSENLIKEVEESFNISSLKFKEFNKKKNCIFICRVYILNVSNLKTSDSNIEDAFVWIKRFKDDREYKDSKRPFKVNTGEINCAYSLEVIWPDSFFIDIEIYENLNSLGIIRENFIGSTHIDLERRYFHPVYQQKLKNHKKFKQIPIESRALYGRDGKMATGAIRMWLEIVPKKKNDDFPITPLIAQNMEKYEMRIVIWNTRDVPLLDGKVNIQVRIQMFDGKKEVEEFTDTHNNSKDGIGEFNYRIVIPFYYPSNKTNLNISIFNDNIITKDEILGFANLDMRKYYANIHKSKMTYEIAKEWVPLEPSPQVQGNYDSGGEVEMELKILTWQEAENNRVGKGQDDPNKDPVLEAPKNGRNFLDSLSFIGDLIDKITDFAGGYMMMIKVLGLIGTIVGIAYFIMQMVKG